MDRVAYNDCMRKFITGSMPKEVRAMRFCIGAKICSGKAPDEKEAERLCLLPKPPKEIKPRRGRSRKSCEAEMQQAAQCVVSALELEIEVSEVYKVLVSCACGKPAKNATGKIKTAEIMTPEREEAMAVMTQLAKEYGAG